MLENQLDQLLEALAPKLQDDSPFILAIDGRCASGKTTLAQMLQQVTGASIIHLDDFFLRPEQRTPERLASPGENIDWERIICEVLKPLNNGESYHYRPFDCHTMDFKPADILQPAHLTVLEGSYSCNDHLWAYSDYHVFMKVSPEIQLQRICTRNGEDGAAVFRDKWIPLEERYFQMAQHEKRCELVLYTD